jgi:hypothetical protein
MIGKREHRDKMAGKAREEPMPTIEGKAAGRWIDDYVKKAGTLASVMKAVRALVKNSVKGSEEYVNPWKIPSVDSHGPLCCFMAGKEHVTFAFFRGAVLPDPEKLLEGTGKGVRHVKLRTVAEVKHPGVKQLIAEAAKLNKKHPPSGMMVGMEKRKVKTKTT